ncbi:MAG TPA: hypothetical protein VJN88_16695 [Ktedonobacterales bacterium]|nr:hypothetical protein [Ktedonobacterales bacterium]
MKTDTRASRPMTIADLCEAISDERIGYARRGDIYEVSGLHLTRYLRGEQPRGSLEPPHVALDPETLDSGCTA